MTKQQIIDYVMNTPENINPSILSQLIEEYEGGSAESFMGIHSIEVPVISHTVPQALADKIDLMTDITLTVYLGDRASESLTAFYATFNFIPQTTEKMILPFLETLECEITYGNCWIDGNELSIDMMTSVGLENITPESQLELHWVYAD